jgi:zona occludens toxin
LITAVTGTPGAGKGVYAVRKSVEAIERGKVLVTNVPMVADWTERVAYRHPVRRLIPKRRGKLAARYQRHVLYVRTLEDLARVRVPGDEEGRWIAVIDEAGDFLNAREWREEGRKENVGWFNKHRHLGADVYLIAQDLDNLDRQVRSKAEYVCRLRNLRRMKVAGIPVSPVNLFLAITRWNDPAKTVAKRECYTLNWTKDLYDTHGAVDLDGPPPDAILLPRPPLNAAPAGHASASAISAEGAAAPPRDPLDARIGRLLDLEERMSDRSSHPDQQSQE